ncbi:MAG: hypothetical protein N5P05_003969 [Chroococcopsis gigantea SAG 12.99]|jgi:proteasome lid subunit RPN8/RPN11|nr:M67 family metallopeptidase [Chlorogloea purpurea SAG 13.99]MDV3002363.1 hypothetical protein [Chroococcopsis gigantea SAG 12.99]
MLILNTDDYPHLCRHAENTYPQECCGVLLGHITREGKQVREIRETPNDWQPEAQRNQRFRISPLLLLQLQKEARDRHLEIIGIYHSHPDYSAVASETDRSLAWPQYSYFILSVEKGQVKDCLSWQLDDSGQFQAETIVWR